MPSKTKSLESPLILDLRPFQCAPSLRKNPASATTIPTLIRILSECNRHDDRAKIQPSYGTARLRLIDAPRRRLHLLLMQLKSVRLKPLISIGHFFLHAVIFRCTSRIRLHLKLPDAQIDINENGTGGYPELKNSCFNLSRRFLDCEMENTNIEPYSCIIRNLSE